jgi:enoyl-CoA hydratase
VTEPVAIEDVEGVAVVRIQRPPANALDPGLLAAGARAVERLRDAQPAAIVVTGSGKFFSGGVDLKLAPTLSAAEQREMVVAINRLFTDWYGLDLPVVAAVNGHAVAGGLILALCADHRVGSLVGSYGLTEVKVGAPYPAAAIGVVRAELGPVAARRLVLGGELIGAEAALAEGIFDELAEPEDALAAGIEAARRLAAHPAATYARVKAELRGPARAAIAAAVERDPLVDAWLSAETAGAAASALGR